MILWKKSTLDVLPRFGRQRIVDLRLDRGIKLGRLGIACHQLW